MPETCGICRRMERFTPDNPYVIAELATGFAVLADNQFYRGYTIFLAKRCVAELHLLDREERDVFLREFALVAEAVFRVCMPRKMNYELLGNSEPHLHWHIFPRYADDENPSWPVWNNEAFVRAYTGPRSDDRTALDELRPLIRREIDALRT